MVFLIEGRHRNRRNLMLMHKTLAEGLIGFIQPERREIDIQE